MKHLLPNDPKDILSLAPEELAGYVMQWLNSLPDANRVLNVNNFSLDVRSQFQNDEITYAMMEAWAWIVREGLIAPKPGSANFYFISRRGRRIKHFADLEAMRNADKLPREILHPQIAVKIWATFLRGDFDTAVFQAFREVEIAVRAAGCFSAGDLGTDLMRKAFKAGSGPLCDESALASEQEAVAHLFAGAIGLCKNPPSHREIDVQQAETIELLMLASHLMRIVDSRAK